MKLNPNIINQELEKRHFTLENDYFNVNEFNDYMIKAKYIKNYPSYVNEDKVEPNLIKKPIQHFLSIASLKLNEIDILLDVASGNFVFPDVLENVLKCKRVYSI